MLHQAHASGEEHILMKLDISKAFDRLEWDFILAIVERVGLAGVLSRFLRSGFNSAASHIILNGRPMQTVRLARSMRQGCPLSPLVFILAFDSITQVFSYAMERRAIVGVYFPKLNRSNLLSKFADDFIVLTRARMGYMMEIKRILQVFGAASGLVYVWEQTKAAFIPEAPPPPEFYLLPWAWEETVNATPSLGYPIASSFSSPRMEETVQGKLSSTITRYRGRHLSLSARVVVANSLIMSTLWYLLTLWAGDLALLNKLQKQIDNFVWAGKSRVNRQTATQSKALGGLGLLSVEEQYRAIAGNLMIWLLGPDDHLLREILCGHIKELSRRKWGYPDMTWLVTPGGSKHYDGSAPWRNICLAWSKLKPFLAPRAPCNLHEWSHLPLWRPHRNHRILQQVRCSTRAHHTLRHIGLHTMQDVTSHNGAFLQWQDLPANIAATGREREYQTLLTNLQRIPTVAADSGQQSIFFADTREPQHQLIWQFNIAPLDVSDNWALIYPRYSPDWMFVARAGILTRSGFWYPPHW